jgi:hypothetical protein
MALSSSGRGTHDGLDSHGTRSAGARGDQENGLVGRDAGATSTAWRRTTGTTNACSSSRGTREDDRIRRGTCTRSSARHEGQVMRLTEQAPVEHDMPIDCLGRQISADQHVFVNPRVEQGVSEKARQPAAVAGSDVPGLLQPTVGAATPQS